MPSTYTLNNGIELIGTGEQSGTWGDTTNTNFDLVDTALDGQVSILLSGAGSSGSPNDLPISDGTSSNGRNRMITFTDGTDLGATAFVQLTPNDSEKIIYVRNDLSGSRSIILFQGTYNASNDYEVPAGTTAVVYFDGAGSGAVAANVFNNAYFDSLRLGGVSVTAIIDDDSMGTASATNIATSESIKAYVDAQVGAFDSLAEVLAVGNTTGGTDLAVSAGDDITFTNSSKAIFGTGSILEIYGDGSNSYIADTGTGDLFIKASDNLFLRDGNDNNILRASEDAEVKLYYNNAAKLSTTSTGIDVTGTVTSDGLTVDGTGTAIDLRSNNNGGTALNTLRFTDTDVTAVNNAEIGKIEFYATDTAAVVASIAGRNADASPDGYLQFNTAEGTTLRSRMVIDNTGDISFYEDTGTTAKFFWDASAESLGIGTISPSTALEILSSTADQITLVHDSTVSGPNIVFKNNGGSLARIASAETNTLRFEVGPSATAVMNITTTGIDVTGTVTADGLTVDGNIIQSGGDEIQNSGTLRLNGDYDASGAGNLELKTKGILRQLVENGGDISFYEDTGTTPKFFWDASAESLGIGTDSPTQKLDITSAGTTRAFIRNTNLTSSGMYIGEDGTGQQILGTGAYPMRFGTNGSEAMRIDASGNVGIGTDSPIAVLHVDMGTNTSDLAGVLIATENDSNATGPDLTFRRRSASPADNDSIGTLHFYGNNSASEDTKYARIIVQTRDVTDGNEDGTIKMNVTKAGVDVNVLSVTSVNSGNNAGSVGINVAGDTPQEALDVRGDTPFIEIRDNTSGTWDYNDVFSGLKFSTNDPDVGGAGQVNAFVKAIHTRAGTGHSNPDAGLSFGTSQGVTPIAIERMRITNDGFVGINEENPTAPLHITLNDNSDFIHLECTDGDTTEGPQVHFYRNSPSPADNDKIGVIKFKGNNSSGADVSMLEIACQVDDVTAGSEDSTVNFIIQKDGAQRNALTLRSTEAVFNQNSVVMDLRVESGTNTHMLFVDAAGDQVKIGNNTAAGGQEGNSYLSVSAPVGTRSMDIDRATTTASNHLVNFYSNVGGTNTLVCNIEASGDLENQNNRYTGFSDVRLKQDIVDANSQWDDIKALQVRKYRFINHVETMGDDASVQLGVIAQELEASGMNGLVNTKPIDENDPDGPDRKSVAYSVLYMKAVKALQEAMERIETLEAKVTALENS